MAASEEPGGRPGRQTTRSEYWREVPAVTWLLVGFAALVLLIGFGGMALLGADVSGQAVATLVTAIFGVVATHVGHVTGHNQATRQTLAEQPHPRP
jgi:fatty acid desaturase